jgi:hypothetical protein
MGIGQNRQIQDSRVGLYISGNEFMNDFLIYEADLSFTQVTQHTM